HSNFINVDNKGTSHEDVFANKFPTFENPGLRPSSQGTQKTEFETGHACYYQPIVPAIGD
ncbi:hypothetical protein QUF90_06625, partial [Desulfococcaceae bacterium HSG9]|nr:hypothetical protein [Desulfococcaceae bacterium HSG9]